MRVLRSWPRQVPPGRAHVIDDLERLVIDRFDYTPLGAIDDDVLMIEWDMAIDRLDLEAFWARAEAEPSRVRVAPYRLFHYPARPHWAHRVLTGPNQGDETWVEVGEPCCDWFGFGLAYLPRDLVRAFLAAPAPQRGRDPRLPPEAAYDDGAFTDQQFSVWHRKTVGQVPIDWDIRPVHLHW